MGIDAAICKTLKKVLGIFSFHNKYHKPLIFNF